MKAYIEVEVFPLGEIVQTTTHSIFVDAIQAVADGSRGGIAPWHACIVIGGQLFRVNESRLDVLAKISNAIAKTAGLRPYEE